MLIRTVAIGMLSALALSQAVLAAGPSDPTPEVAVTTPATPEFTPADTFAGAYIGGQLGYGSVDVGPSIEGDGLLYGVHAGYNLALGRNIVVGAEVDFDAADVALSGGAGDLDSVLRLKLRGGTEVGRMFVYGSTGWAEASTSDLGEDDGIFYGLGAAYDLGNQVTIGGEYLYHDFEDFNGSGLDVDAGTFTARMSYNF